MSNIFIAALFPLFLLQWCAPSLGLSDIDRRYPKPCVALDLCYLTGGFFPCLTKMSRVHWDRQGKKSMMRLDSIKSIQLDCVTQRYPVLPGQSSSPPLSIALSVTETGFEPTLMGSRLAEKKFVRRSKITLSLFIYPPQPAILSHLPKVCLRIFIFIFAF
ncbi:Uncharacterized protein HZ326_1250 [Fusarium oxysporum f. sp. albedinis]|nr:Uncharacterized protein HZ326_1250 [Fusarium oxysporum f. sp. albedinis]